MFTGFKQGLVGPENVKHSLSVPLNHDTMYTISYVSFKNHEYDQFTVTFRFEF